MALLRGNFLLIFGGQKWLAPVKMWFHIFTRFFDSSKIDFLLAKGRCQVFLARSWVQIWDQKKPDLVASVFFREGQNGSWSLGRVVIFLTRSGFQGRPIRHGPGFLFSDFWKIGKTSLEKGLFFHEALGFRQKGGPKWTSFLADEGAKTPRCSGVRAFSHRSLRKLSSVVGFWPKTEFSGEKTQHAAAKLVFRVMLSFLLENGSFSRVSNLFEPEGGSIFTLFLRRQVNSGKNAPNRGIFAGKNGAKMRHFCEGQKWPVFEVIFGSKVRDGWTWGPEPGAGSRDQKWPFLGQKWLKKVIFVSANRKSDLRGIVFSRAFTREKTIILFKFLIAESETLISGQKMSFSEKGKFDRGSRIFRLSSKNGWKSEFFILEALLIRVFSTFLQKCFLARDVVLDGEKIWFSRHEFFSCFGERFG